MLSEPPVTNTPSAKTQPDWPAWLVVIPIGLATALMLWHLKKWPVWIDEAFSVAYARLSWPELYAATRYADAVFAPYYVLLHGWFAIGGNSLYTARLLSVVAALGTIVIVFAIGSRLFDRRTAFFACIFLSTNLLFLHEGREARMYALDGAIESASWLVLLILIWQPTMGVAIALGVLEAISFWIHPLATLNAVAQLLFLATIVRERDLLVPIAVAYLVSVLLSLPLIVFSRTAGIGQVSWIHKPSPAEIVQSLLDSSGLIPLILGLILMSVEIYLGWKRRDVRVALLTSWLLVPGILAIALSYVSHPVYVIRYFIECIPPAALLMAHAISRIPSLNWRYTAFATVLLGSFTTIRHSYERPLMNWPAAMATVKSDSAEREALAFSPPGMLVAYRIAQEQAGSSSKTPIIYPNPNAPFWESKKMTQLAPAGYKTIWIFGQDRFMGDVGALIGGDYALASTTHDGPALVLQRFRSR